MSYVLKQALTEVWNWRSRPEQLFEQAEFKSLVATCDRLFPHAGGLSSLPWALSNALDRLGAPYSLPRSARAPLSPVEACEYLERGFLANEARRIHICPLDLADDLPGWSFGDAEVRVLSATELLDIVDPLGVDRLRPFWTFDAERFTKMNWLIVRETVALAADVGQRAVPWLFETIDRDFFKIEPHQERYPAKVEEALFVLLLAPWEDWTEYRELNWRAFNVPWVHTVNEDPFVSRHRLPSAGTLSFEPDIFEHDGEVIELERRVRYRLSDEVLEVHRLVDDALVDRARRASASNLFETPVAHFFVRAFAADGIDEFLGHLTMLEAALGQHEGGATARVKQRLAGLLGDATVAGIYGDLFDLRSQFVHGRRMTSISGEDRCKARNLARRAAAALVERACRTAPEDRTADLEILRAAGAALLTQASANVIGA